MDCKIYSNALFSILEEPRENLKRKNSEILGSNMAKRVCHESQLTFCMHCGEYTFTEDGVIAEKHTCDGKTIDADKVKKCIDILSGVLPSPPSPPPRPAALFANLFSTPSKSNGVIPPPPPPPPPPTPFFSTPSIQNQKPKIMKKPLIMTKTSQQDDLFDELRSVLRYGCLIFITHYIEVYNIMCNDILMFYILQTKVSTFKPK